MLLSSSVGEDCFLHTSGTHESRGRCLWQKLGPSEFHTETRYGRTFHCNYSVKCLVPLCCNVLDWETLRCKQSGSQSRRFLASLACRESHRKSWDEDFIQRCRDIRAYLAGHRKQGVGRHDGIARHVLILVFGTLVFKPPSIRSQGLGTTWGSGIA
jgi:hypothetical protein